MKRLDVVNKVRGLNLQSDPLEAQEGDFLRARNCWANTEGVLEARRGFNRYGDVASGAIGATFEYKNRILRHVANTTLQYDSDGAGTFTSYSGTIAAPDSETKIRNLEAQGRNYFLTANGVYRQNGLTDTPQRAGIEPFLELTLALTHTGGGFVLPDSAISYRLVWGRREEDGTLYLGEPSFKFTVINPAATTESYASTDGDTTITVTTTADHGHSEDDVIIISNCDAAELDGNWTISAVPTSKTFKFDYAGPPSPSSGACDVSEANDVTIEFPIPEDVVAGDFYEVYRTAATAEATTLTGEEFFKVVRVDVTSGDISAGYITHTDDLINDFVGEHLRLYTNPSEGSLARSNARPPYALDLTLYRGHVIYSNVKWEEELELRLLSTTGLVAGTSSITIGAETYTFESAESVGDKEFKLFTAGSDAEDVRDTALSLVRIINRASTYFYAFYISLEDDPPGMILVRRRTLNTASFAVTANNATTGGDFEPTLPTSGTTISSSPPGGLNVFAVSKYEQPESVPRLSTDTIGQQDNPILRGINIEESVVFLLKYGGFFILSGDSDGTVGATFYARQRDSSLRILGRETAVKIQNSVICYSNQGFVQLNENGAAIIGRKIEKEIERISSTTNWETLAFAISYESADMYICFGPQEITDTYSTLAWCYNVLLESFVDGIEKNITSGHVLSEDDKLYLSHAVDYYTLQERKTHVETTDYRDESISVTITAATSAESDDGYRYSIVTLTYSYTGVELSAGFRLNQGVYYVSIESVEDLGSNSYQVECYEEAPFVAGAATVDIPIYCELWTAPLVGTNAAVLKHIPEVQFDFERDSAKRFEVGFSSDIVPSGTYIDSIYDIYGTAAGFGNAPFGENPFGDEWDYGGQPLVVNVPEDYQRARRLIIMLRHNVAGEKLALSQIATQIREISYRGAYKVPR